MKTIFFPPFIPKNLTECLIGLPQKKYAIVFEDRIEVRFLSLIAIHAFKTTIKSRNPNNIIGIWKPKKTRIINTKPLDYEVSISTFLPPVDTSLKREIPQHLMQKKTFLGSYVGDFIDQNHFKNYLP